MGKKELRELMGIIQNKNAAFLVKNILGILGKQEQSIKGRTACT